MCEAEERNTSYCVGEVGLMMVSDRRSSTDNDENDDSKVFITVRTVALNWNAWVPWSRLEPSAHEHAEVCPPESAGVYELKYIGQEVRLAIGAAHNLRLGLQEALVQGRQPHPVGRRIQEHEDTTRLEIRWAENERPSETQEDLYVGHLARFGQLPKYLFFI